MKAYKLFFSVVFFLLINNFCFSQGSPGSGMTNDIRLYKKAEAEARKKRAATEKSLAAHRRKQAEIERKKRIAEQKRIKEIEQLEYLQNSMSHYGYGTKNCEQMIRVTINHYSDGTSSTTITRSDGSTQNTFYGPTHSDPSSHGTAGTASHKEFAKEASQSKEANGVSVERTRSFGRDFR